MSPFKHHPSLSRSLAPLAATLALAGTGSAQAALNCNGAGLTGPGSWTCTETLSQTAETLPQTGSTTSMPISLWSATATNGFQGGGLAATLTQVSWSAQGTFVNAGAVANDNAFPDFVYLSVTDGMTWSSISGAPTSFQPNPLTAQKIVDLVILKKIGAFASISAPPRTTVLGPLLGSTVDVAGWIGTGSFDESLALFADVEGAGDFGATTGAQASLTLTYTGVTAVPEAPTGGLLAAGLLSTGWLARRRRNSEGIQTGRSTQPGAADDHDARPL